MKNLILLHTLLNHAENVKLDGITVRVYFSDSVMLEYIDQTGTDVQCYVPDVQVELQEDGTVEVTTYQSEPIEEGDVGERGLLTLSMLHPMTPAYLEN